MLDRLRWWVMCRRWSDLPDWLWFLVASPLLRFALGTGPWFQWPLPDPFTGYPEDGDGPED